MRYFIYLILITSTSIHAGSIIKWVDVEGNIYYGDSPPSNVETQEVRVVGAPSKTGKALPRLNNGAESETMAGGTEQPALKQLSNDQAKVACDIAQEDFKTLSQGGRIILKSADGTSRYMTPDEIVERRIKAEAEIKNYCK